MIGITNEPHYGKDKLLRADKVLSMAKHYPPQTVFIEGRVVNVKFDEDHKSDAGTNDEFLLFYNDICAFAFFEEIRKYIR